MEKFNKSGYFDYQYVFDLVEYVTKLEVIDTEHLQKGMTMITELLNAQKIELPSETTSLTFITLIEYLEKDDEGCSFKQVVFTDLESHDPSSCYFCKLKIVSNTGEMLNIECFADMVDDHEPRDLGFCDSWKLKIMENIKKHVNDVQFFMNSTKTSTYLAKIV